MSPMASVTNRPLGAGISAVGVLATIVAAVSAWNDARITRKSLSRLSDRELDDLGLVRGDIEEIATGEFQR